MSAFRTLRVSDPRFERDHLRHITVKSPALHGRGDILLYLPPSPGPMPLVVLLHGVYGSHWSWALQGGVHLTAQTLIDAGSIGPMAIAMPSDGLWGDGSGYLAHSGRDFERWIVNDVPAAAGEVAPSQIDPGTCFIAGLSMGGYGALRIGASHPSRFRGIAAHSAITRLDEMAPFVEEPLAAYAPAGDDRSVLGAIHAPLPPLRFDCGTEDPLLEANRALHAALLDRGIPHTYDEFPGGHEWPYWERAIGHTLRFFDAIARGYGQ